MVAPGDVRDPEVDRDGTEEGGIVVARPRLQAVVARLERTPEATVRSRVRAGLRRLSLALEDLLAGGAERSVPLGAQRKGCGA